MEPYDYLQNIAARLDGLRTRGEITAALDELEYLYETLDPEFQDLAGGMIETLQARLASAPAAP